MVCVWLKARYIKILPIKRSKVRIFDAKIYFIDELFQNCISRKYDWQLIIIIFVGLAVYCILANLSRFA